MALYNSDYLRGLSKNKSQTTLNNILNESKYTRQSYDIFLSHSFLDKEEVEGLYIELTSFGFTVYVDWIVDPNLDRSNVTKATAELIRKRLKLSKSLLLAVSINAEASKWMPWELGVVDGSCSRCGIIPVSRSTNPPKSYEGREFLSLYPFIKRAPSLNGVNKLFVIESAYKYVQLEEWVNKNIQPAYQTRDILQF